MKKKELLGELWKRFKYTGFINSREGDCYDSLMEYNLRVAIVEENFVHEDRIYFWVRNEGKADEDVLGVRWKGTYPKINEEIESILKDNNI